MQLRGVGDRIGAVVMDTRTASTAAAVATAAATYKPKPQSALMSAPGPVTKAPTPARVHSVRSFAPPARHNNPPTSVRQHSSVVPTSARGSRAGVSQSKLPPTAMQRLARAAGPAPTTASFATQPQRGSKTTNAQSVQRRANSGGTGPLKQVVAAAVVRKHGEKPMQSVARKPIEAAEKSTEPADTAKARKPQPAQERVEVEKVETYDSVWQELAAKLPTGATDEDKKKRDVLFRQFDPNGNGYLSVAEIDAALMKVLDCEALFDAK